MVALLVGCAGGHATGAADAGQSCAAGQTLCGGACTSLQTDPANCGDCAHACAASDSCASGACVHLDCRAAGVQCAQGTYCSLNDGRCLPGCAQDDQCGAGSSCDLGTHACVCDPGKHACGGACVSEDQNSCGASCEVCAVPGGGAASCVGGVCQEGCGGATHLCGDTCVSNGGADHCGASCTPCTAPAHATATCDGASCGFACDSGYSPCGGACVDLSSDDSHCGACDVSCNFAEACSAGVCRATCVGTPGFGAPVAIGAVGTYLPVALDDFGKRGVNDLVALDGGSQVLLAQGRGDGGFAAPHVRGDFGGTAFEVFSADVSGDGRPDLVGVVGYAALPLIEQADGGFEAGNAAQVGAVLHAAVADLNGDGLADVVTIDDGRVGVGVAMGTDAGFGTPQVVPVNSGFFVTHTPVALALCDFDGDGRPDAIISDTYNPAFGDAVGEVKVLLNDGRGALGAPANVFTGSTQGGKLVAGNFTAAGSCDVAYDDNGSLKLLVNNGHAGFTVSSSSPVFTGRVDALLVVPFHGKGGVDDLLLLSGGTLTLLHGGFGELSQQVPIPAGTSPWPAALGLVDGDLIPDLIVTSGAGTSSSFLPGTCQ
jgi:hypothetical protein